MLLRSTLVPAAWGAHRDGEWGGGRRARRRAKVMGLAACAALWVIAGSACSVFDDSVRPGLATDASAGAAGGEADSSGGDSSGGGGSSGVGGAPLDASGGDAGNIERDGGPLGPCPERIVLIDDRGAIWSYAPDSNAFASHGTLPCAAGALALAVADDGTLLVSNSSSQVLSHAIGAPACQTTPFDERDLGYTQFSIAFTAISRDGGKVGELWAASADRIAPVLLPEYVIRTALPLSGAGAPLLAGNTTGRIFTYRPGTGRLSEIDRQSGGRILDRVVDATPSSRAGFALWGGHAWVFELAASLDRSEITRYSIDDNVAKVVGTTPGFVVMLAATSACAP